MTTDAERIIDKIRKLQAHADSANEIGSEAEAQAFAAKIQELLTAYKLSSTDVNRPGKEHEPINATYFGWADLGLKIRRVRVGWAERLARLVARAYYCEFVVTTANGLIGIFVGTETDRKIALFMFVTLGRFLDQLADREARRYHYQRWKAAGSPKTGRTRSPARANPPDSFDKQRNDDEHQRRNHRENNTGHDHPAADPGRWTRLGPANLHHGAANGR